MQSLGILGVGELTEKVVRGLRGSGFDGPILLSPRNAERAQTLAADYACEVMPSNQALVDNASILLLGTRPDSVAQLATEISLKPGQHLLSLVAGLDMQTLRATFPGALCVRVMLSYAAQFNESTVVVYPPDKTTQACLGPLGTLVVMENEAAFELATVAACMNGWFYFLLHDLQYWLVDKGLPIDQARTLVLGNLEDCVATARTHPDQSLKALGQAIATPGTFTAAGLEVLNHQPGSATWGAACEVVFDALLNRVPR
ncbi:NAD(P)-binding domain-containing protein [Pseudomonas sp. R5(2019)]|uniref:NAD(P)-binding domain-containing protein n=1 Tax=Pseudomonas sp. R5(2019) TaxID=2697566 RepID=UPI001412B475|nr:NAD(P)-binding domain-containing protein [Pseudomonas sp. R5(2019)]NBA98080.1 NAD(P)-binding domain-containing protein [Pseudomonas sp. R5(2019)]